MLGTYPCPSKRMYVVGLPNECVADLNSQDVVHAAIRSRLGELIKVDQAVARAIAEAREFFSWPMHDVRMKRWSKGRVVLCGDAGMAFLPTAGVGASNALRSAAALADELSLADARLAPLAILRYEKRCFKIVKTNQQDSRNAGRLVFVESNALSWVRDQIIKRIPVSKFVRGIIKSMKEPF